MDNDVEGDVKGEEDDNVGNGNVEEKEDEDVEGNEVEGDDVDVKCHRPAGSKKRGPHFLSAGAVEMHVSMSQQLLFTEICRQNAADQSCGAQLVLALRTQNALQHFTIATLYRN